MGTKQTKPMPLTSSSQEDEPSPPQPLVVSSMSSSHSHLHHEDPLIAPLASSSSSSNNTPSPRPPQPTADLMNELHQYLSMDDYDKYTAGLFLTSLGCQKLQEIGLIRTTDFRAAFQSYNSNNANPSLLVGSKLIKACKILNHDGTLDELRRISDAKSELVSFIVGGTRFTSSLSTLCRVPGSYLECLFSGRHVYSMRRLKSGEYFIDRSSRYVPFILDYLRHGRVLTLPKNDDEKDALASEAEFYGLPDLARAIRGPRVWTAMFLAEETLLIHTDEQNLRLQLYQKENGPVAHWSEKLIPLFTESERGHYECPIRCCPHIDDDVELIIGKMERASLKDGHAMTVDSINKFEQNFHRQHANVLHRLLCILREEPVVIAGGSVLAALRTWPTSNNAADQTYSSKDVDIFICTTDKLEAERIAERVWKALAVDQERWVIVRTPGVINMHLWGGQGFTITETVQVVLRLYGSPTEVLFSFDCDCCCCAYNGRDVLLTPRCYLALKRLVNVLNPIHAWPNRPSYELRLAKYAKRGFAVAIPGLDRSRIDYSICTKEFSKLQGLARLLRIEFEFEREKSILGRPDLRAEPRRIDALRKSATDDLDPARALLLFANGFYDETPSKVMVPSVFCRGRPVALDWYVGTDTDDFPPSSETRDLAWEEIVDYTANADVDQVPHSLVDAWSDSSKSREFLNMRMNQEDVDNLYYMGAYKIVELTRDRKPLG